MSMAEYYAHKDAERPDGSVDFDEVPLRFGGNKNNGSPPKTRVEEPSD
ncbi:hypothetical protein GS930_01415 [Rhodococcus hoagii]|nr:hypothetical protein [Prescottella equi]